MFQHTTEHLQTGSSLFDAMSQILYDDQLPILF